MLLRALASLHLPPRPFFPPLCLPSARVSHCRVARRRSLHPSRQRSSPRVGDARRPDGAVLGAGGGACAAYGARVGEGRTMGRVVAQAGWGGAEAGVGRAVVLWDLDNVQPERMEPFQAAVRLRDLAAAFGAPVDIVAYANRHAFDFVPSWVREQRRAQKEEERLEARGLLEREEPLTCQLCGRRCSSSMALRKHFVSLHKREHEKRMQHLNHASPKRQRRLREAYRGKQQRYQEAVRGVLQPKRGYGLMPELRRAGVVVRLVSQQSQAADEALKRDMGAAVRSGQVASILLVSDDRGYSRALGAAAAAGLTTIAVGTRGSLQSCVHRWFWWGDVLSGRAVTAARREAPPLGEAAEGEMRGGEAWGEGEVVVVGERVQQHSGGGSRPRGGLIGLEDVKRGGGRSTERERWTHGEGKGQGDEWRQKEERKWGHDTDEEVECEEGGEEWLGDEWDEDEWEEEGWEEDNTGHDNNQGYSHQVFGGADSVSRPQGPVSRPQGP